MRSVQVRVVREIRTLRVMRRELETGLRTFLAGHEGGNPGHRQGTSYRTTAPALDPTRIVLVASGGDYFLVFTIDFKDDAAIGFAEGADSRLLDRMGLVPGHRVTSE